MNGASRSQSETLRWDGIIIAAREQTFVSADTRAKTMDLTVSVSLSFGSDPAVIAIIIIECLCDTCTHHGAQATCTHMHVSPTKLALITISNHVQLSDMMIESISDQWHVQLSDMMIEST
eukprot:TRINITY_DN1346_c0_g1_i4.p2 TRINITY_DN1346_c0_g1~~TRINITY_DN1346_c0_g1_i4.p2  ORF type:complete len:120 (+),score=8.76 TRINITY_DN1346_c0_g1_i4:1688-2047(+)